MKLEELKNEVYKNRKDLKIEYYTAEQNKYVDKQSPACVMDKNLIHIWSEQSEEDKTMSEAHELGHFLMEDRGLVHLEMSDIYIKGDCLDYLALEINNSISHYKMIKVLKDEFDISSDLHLKLRSNIINNIKQYNNTSFKYWLYGAGIGLYDLYRTDDNYKDEIEELLKSNIDENGYINEAFNLASEFLQQVNNNVSKEIQESNIRALLERLNVPIEYIEII